MKILFIVIDGLADRPIKELANKTPLQAASTPNLDRLARAGLCGLIKPIYRGAIPTSEEGHFALFGYDPRLEHIGRGMFTASGAGIKLKPGDIAWRGNFATVDEKLNIIDRRAGRLKDSRPLIKALQGIVIDKIRFLIKEAGQHRLALVMRQSSSQKRHLLSDQVCDSDPHYSYLGKKARKILPLAGISPDTRLYQRARFTSNVLNKFLEKAHQILQKHPLNTKRRKQGKLPANYILLRGASSLKKIASFKKKYHLRASCVAGKLLYQQIALALGMHLIKVKGANGTITTNLRGKFLAAKEALAKYDFVFLHIKATDTLAEDGDFRGKRDFIEKIDRELKNVIPKNSQTKQGKTNKFLIVITTDHATCSKLKRHCQGLLPVLIWGNGQDRVKQFSEKACQKGGLGKINALELMPIIIQKSR